jgi:hypothetical protein
MGKAGSVRDFLLLGSKKGTSKGAKKALPVKLIVGLIFPKEALLEKAELILSKKFGTIDFKSQILPFEHTDYYWAELGRPLKRKFLSFARLILPENLPEIKLYTKRVEHALSIRNSRQINIDPGYLSLSKLVLATTKDYTHRIYLRRGIYAEVTLFYRKGSFSPWEWTYPDYKSADYIDIFNRIRNLYKSQLEATTRSWRQTGS